jgi:hypothetical protein
MRRKKGNCDILIIKIIPEKTDSEIISRMFLYIFYKIHVYTLKSSSNKWFVTPQSKEECQITNICMLAIHSSKKSSINFLGGGVNDFAMTFLQLKHKTF